MVPLVPGRWRLGAVVRELVTHYAGQPTLETVAGPLAVRARGAVLDGRALPLTPAGACILAELAAAAGAVVPRERLQALLPGGSSDGHAVETAIARLRESCGSKDLVARSSSAATPWPWRRRRDRRARRVRARHPRPAGRATIAAVVAAVAARLPAVGCSRPTSTCTGRTSPRSSRDCRRAGRRRGVVVPLLLAGGYHVHVDIAQAVAGRPTWSPRRRARARRAPRRPARRRSRPAAASAGMPVVLVPAGSSDARAQADSADVAPRPWHGGGAAR